MVRNYPFDARKNGAHSSSADGDVRCGNPACPARPNQSLKVSGGCRIKFTGKAERPKYDRLRDRKDANLLSNFQGDTESD